MVTQSKKYCFKWLPLDCGVSVSNKLEEHEHDTHKTTTENVEEWEEEEKETKAEQTGNWYSATNILIHVVYTDCGAVHYLTHYINNCVVLAAHHFEGHIHETHITKHPQQSMRRKGEGMKDTLRRQFFFSNVVEALFSSLVYLWCSKYAGDDFLSHNHAASSQNVLLKIMKRSSRKENSKYMSACCNHENCGVSVFHKSESQVHESHGHKTATWAWWRWWIWAQKYLFDVWQRFIFSLFAFEIWKRLQWW